VGKDPESAKKRSLEVKKMRRGEGHSEGRGKMDEKKTNLIRTIERSESLTQGFFVVPLPSEAVFPLPSILSQRTKPS
jgi:hypothetical protein